MRANYYDLDVAKLLMAFLVVEIHARPLMEFPLAEKIIEGIDVVAVPFFFMASAFLCFRGLDEASFVEKALPGAVRVRNTIGRLLKLYLIWTVLYLPVTAFGSVIHGDCLAYALAVFVRGTLFIGENYYSWPLWYLLASAVGFALVYICLRGGVRSRHTVLLSFALLSVGFIIDFVQGWEDAPAALSILVKIYGTVFGSARNGIFEGFFYVAMGAFFGMNFRDFEIAPVWAEVMLVVFGLSGTILVSNDAHLPFCIAASTGLFLLSIRRCGANLKPHEWARNTSTIVYLVHMYFIVLFVYGIYGGTNANLYANGVNGPLLYLFALGSSALFSALVIVSSKRTPFLRKVFGI